jgi:general secretion pathway protein E
MKDNQAIAQDFQIEYVKNLSHFRFVKEKVQVLPYAMAKELMALPVDENTVAFENLLDLEALETVQTTLGKKIKEICAPKEAILAAIEACYHQKEEKLFEASLEKHVASSDEYDLLAQTADSPVIRLLNLVLTEAISQGASDIHFEPVEQGVSVRFRIDGVLQKRHLCPKDLQNQLLARIKVLAKLDIAEQRLPQDGRIKLKIGGREIDFRVSTIPVVLGERVVLRILDKGNIILGLSRLGMSKPVFDAFEKLIHLSEGIILVTGPTGSGKTTTLYSAIHDINSPELNIMTIEDPVEYRLPDMAQVGVNPKIDLYFATGLRHILRQDPDIIMIGEIRDKETAEIAIQASLTGHLVLSTLHTNDAPSALTRLVEMGIEPYLLSSTVVGIMAQRLVRAICPDCKQSYIPSSQEALEVGLGAPAPFFRGAGCEKCFGLGYKGRLGIYELLCMSHPIKQKILKSADAAQLRSVATAQGMVPLRHEGAALILQGLTTSAEVLRVTRGAEE